MIHNPCSLLVSESFDLETVPLGTMEQYLPLIYSEAGGYRPGVLPTYKDVMQSLMYLLRPDRAGKAGRTVKEACRLQAYALIEHWEYCNVYRIHIACPK